MTALVGWLGTCQRRYANVGTMAGGSEGVKQERESLHGGSPAPLRTAKLAAWCFVASSSSCVFLFYLPTPNSARSSSQPLRRSLPRRAPMATPSRVSGTKG